MPYATYKLLHLIGIIVLLLGLGAALTTSKGGAGRSLGMLLHGLGLLVVIVAGFGMQAKGNVGFPFWLWAKVGIWVLLALLPVLVRRAALGASAALFLAALLASGAAYLVLMRPF
ncbi:MAG: hypothetical protein R3F56_12600 [Planctomycetota bacterium]